MSNTAFGISALLSVLAGFFLGAAPMMAVVCVFVVVDLITGVWASLKNSIRIESKKLRKTTLKLLIYLSIILLGYSVDYFITEQFKLATFISTFICFNELYSCLENYVAISGNDVIKKIQDKIKDLMDRHGKTHSHPNN